MRFITIFISVVFIFTINSCQTRVLLVEKDDKSFDLAAFSEKRMVVMPLLIVDNLYNFKSERFNFKFDAKDYRELEYYSHTALVNALTEIGRFEVVTRVNPDSLGKYNLTRFFIIDRMRSHNRLFARDTAAINNYAIKSNADFVMIPVSLLLSHESSDDKKIKSTDAAEPGIMAKIDYAVWSAKSSRIVIHGQTEALVSRGGMLDGALGRNPVKISIDEACRNLARKFAE